MLRAEPEFTLVHLSDTHLRPPSDPLVGGVVDTRATLQRALELLTAWDVRAVAWVFTGDLADIADLGDREAYPLLRGMVEEAAASVGSRVVWVNGNHDDRLAFRADLLGEDVSGAHGDEPLNRTHDVAGLRLITLDSTVPGLPQGVVSEDSLAWLADVLSVPAPHGSVLAVHHAPLPVVQDAAGLWPLENRAALADVVRGSDVRVICSGHFHQDGFGTFAGIPVSLAPSLAYNQDLSLGRTLRGQDAGHGFRLVELHADGVVATTVSLEAAAGVHEVISPEDALRRAARGAWRLPPAP